MARLGWEGVLQGWPLSQDTTSSQFSFGSKTDPSLPKSEANSDAWWHLRDNIMKKVEKAEQLHERIEKNGEETALRTPKCLKKGRRRGRRCPGTTCYHGQEHDGADISTAAILKITLCWSRWKCLKSCSPLRAHAGEGFLSGTAAHGESPLKQTVPEELFPVGKPHPKAEKNNEKKGAAEFYGLTIPHPSTLLRGRKEKRRERRGEVGPAKRCMWGVYSSVLFLTMLFYPSVTLN